MTANHGESHGLIPQPHGGALRNGGTNKGGTGRPPSEVRIKAAQLGYRVIEEGLGILDDPERLKELSKADLARFGELGLRYGVGSKVEVQVSSEAFMQAVGAAGARTLDPETFNAFLVALEEELGNLGFSHGDEGLSDAIVIEV